MKNIIYFFLFTFIFSCKEKSTESKSNISTTKVNLVETLTTDNNYLQIPITCEGEEYEPKKCKNDKKELAYEFISTNNKTIIEFKYKNKGFIHSFNEPLFQLGVKSFLFDNGSKMILVLDSFLEYGHTFYVYQITNDEIKYIDSKSFDFKQDEKEIELKFDFKIIEKASKLTLKLGSSYEDIILNTNNSLALPIKEEIKSNSNPKQPINGSWQLDCNIQNSGIEIYSKDSNMFATVAVAPPAVFIEAKVIKSEIENVFYLRFEEQDMEVPLANENKLDQYTSKNENIARIEFKNDKILYWWYGFYNSKTKKWNFKKSQFNKNENNDYVILKRCD